MVALVGGEAMYGAGAAASVEAGEASACCARRARSSA